MNPSATRGTIAQLLTFATWVLNLTGHPAASAILRDPNLATEVSTFLALAFTLWGVGEHLYASFVANKALKVIGPVSAAQNGLPAGKGR